MKALINALTLALVEGFEGMDIKHAREFATSFVEENAELFASPAPTTAERAKAIVQRAGPQPADLREPGQALGVDEEGNPVLPRAVKHHVPVVGADGLTDTQRNAVASGVGLCPNCQQPKNRHLPGCARASGYDQRAVTKDPLPPVQ